MIKSNRFLHLHFTIQNIKFNLKTDKYKNSKTVNSYRCFGKHHERCHTLLHFQAAVLIFNCVFSTPL